MSLFMQQLYIMTGFVAWWTTITLVGGYALIKVLKYLHRHNTISRLFGWLSRITDTSKRRKRNFS